MSPPQYRYPIAESEVGEILHPCTAACFSVSAYALCKCSTVQVRSVIDLIELTMQSLVGKMVATARL